MTLNNKRIVKNSIFLLSRTILLTLVTLYTLREVISILGAKEFGLYTVVFGIVAMFAFINSAMMSATQRFLSVAIGKHNIEGVKNTFFYSLFIHIILAILMGLFIYLLKNLFLKRFLNVEGYESESEIIYYFAIVNIIISFMQVPFSALITAYEKMQAFAYLAIFEGFFKLAVVYLLIFFEYNKVILYSLFLSVISFLVLVIHVLYCINIFDKIFKSFHFKFLEAKEIIKSMFGFIGWSLIGNLSIVMRNQGANILLNIFFGLTTNAAFAIALTVMSAVGALISSVSNAINPQIFKAYAEGSLSKFYMLISNGSKYYIYILSLITIPLIFLMEYILKLWMGVYPEYTVLFCQLMLIVVVVDSFSNLLTSGIQADGRIKWNQIITGTLLCFPLPITYYFYNNDYSVNFIFYMFIFVSILSISTKLYFIKILTKYSFLEYFVKVFFPGISMIFINSLLMYTVIEFFGIPKEFSDFVLCLVVFGFFGSLLILTFGLSSVEKSKIKFYFADKIGINNFK